MARVVVGVDGSPDAQAALDWATALARSGATMVQAVHVTEPGAAAERLVEDGSPLETRSGDVTEELLAAAPGGDLIVVGLRGGSGRRPGPGPVTEALVRRSGLPVAVVRHGATPALGPGSTVVIGVGYGRATEAALHWVATVAAPWGVRVRLVHAVGLPPLSAEGVTQVLAHVIDPTARRRWAEEDLVEAAAELRRASGDRIEVDWHATSGVAGRALLKEAEHAALVVVGRHHGIVGERIVPPATQLLLARAACPVVVVPAPDDRPER
jgi:nucleotide-binding universal stress UspA family protein